MAEITGDVQTATASAKYVHVAPMKARRVIDLIRDLPAAEALTVLQFAPQAASQPIYKLLASAVANAETNHRLDRESLVVSRAYVDEGPTMKRFRPRAQGRAYRINKRTSHITVEVASLLERPTTRRRTGAAKATTQRSAQKAAQKSARPSSSKGSAR